MTGLSTADTARATSVERRVHPVPTASLRRSEITICPSVRRVATIKGQGRLSLPRYCLAEEVMRGRNFKEMRPCLVRSISPGFSHGQRVSARAPDIYLCNFIASRLNEGSLVRPRYLPEPPARRFDSCFQPRLCPSAGVKFRSYSGGIRQARGYVV